MNQCIICGKDSGFGMVCDECKEAVSYVKSQFIPCYGLKNKDGMATRSLIPCPFCGKIVKFHRMQIDIFKVTHVFDKDEKECNMRLIIYADDEEKAIQVWNKRAFNHENN